MWNVGCLNYPSNHYFNFFFTPSTVTETLVQEHSENIKEYCTVLMLCQNSIQWHGFSVYLFKAIIITWMVITFHKGYIVLHCTALTYLPVHALGWSWLQFCQHAFHVQTTAYCQDAHFQNANNATVSIQKLHPQLFRSTAAALIHWPAATLAHRPVGRTVVHRPVAALVANATDSMCRT